MSGSRYSEDTGFQSPGAEAREEATALRIATSASKRPKRKYPSDYPTPARAYHNVRNPSKVQRYQLAYEKDKDRIPAPDHGVMESYQYGLPGLQSLIDSGRDHDFANNIPSSVPGSGLGTAVKPTRLIGASLLPKLKVAPDSSMTYGSIVNQICQTIGQPLAAIQLFSPMNSMSGSPVVNITDHINQIIRIAAPWSHPTTPPGLDDIILTTKQQIENFKQALVDRVDELASVAYENHYEKRFRNRIAQLNDKNKALADRNGELLAENARFKRGVQDEKRAYYDRQLYVEGNMPPQQPVYTIQAANMPTPLSMAQRDQIRPSGNIGRNRHAQTSFASSLNASPRMQQSHRLHTTSGRGGALSNLTPLPTHHELGEKTSSLLSPSIQSPMPAFPSSLTPLSTLPSPVLSPPSQTMFPALSDISPTSPHLLPYYTSPSLPKNSKIRTKRAKSQDSDRAIGPQERIERETKRRRAKKTGPKRGVGEVVGFDDVGPVFRYRGFGEASEDDESQSTIEEDANQPQKSDEVKSSAKEGRNVTMEDVMDGQSD